MINVLFICHGNICRSPMAEYIFRDMVQRQGLAERFHIASAATSREEIGNDVYPPARAELRAHGVPVGHRAAVQVTPRDYDAYDWLLTMDENNARNLRRILPHDPDGKIRPLLSFAGEQRGIADPWYTDDFGAAYADIVRGCTAFLEHLRRSVNYTMTHLGPHKLPLIGRADWNDCLNLNCFSAHPGESFQITGPSEGPVAESVFIGGMFVKYGTAYARLCIRLGLVDEAAKVTAAVEEMNAVCLSAGWDGAWFRRAYDAYGAPIGSKECKEGQIFIEPQGMCVMAGIGKQSGQALKAMQSVEERLDTKYGIVLLQPAYTEYCLNLGEISSYPPGYKENAGIFCHNNPWVVCAEAEIGRGDRAFQVYARTCPAYTEAISEIHRTEPYVYSQMIAGKDAPSFGEAKNSWLTGTAAWTFLSISQAILGVQPTLDGLSVDPCIPSAWKEYTVHRKYRGADYDITVKNPNAVQKGVASVTVDGAPLTGNVLPIAPKGAKVTVEVTMG